MGRSRKYQYIKGDFAIPVPAAYPIHCYQYIVGVSNTPRFCSIIFLLNVSSLEHKLTSVTVPSNPTQTKRQLQIFGPRSLKGSFRVHLRLQTGYCLVWQCVLKSTAIGRGLARGCWLAGECTVLGNIHPDLREVKQTLQCLCPLSESTANRLLSTWHYIKQHLMSCRYI